MSTQKDYNVLKPAIKSMYMQGSTAPELSIVFKDVPISTIYSWVTKEGWKAERDSAEKNISNAPQVLMAAFVSLLTKVKDEGKAEDLASNADAIAKIAKAYKTLFRESDVLESALWFFKEFGTFLRDSSNGIVIDPEFYEKLDSILQQFQRYLVIKFSPKNVG